MGSTRITDARRGIENTSSLQRLLLATMANLSMWTAEAMTLGFTRVPCDRLGKSRTWYRSKSSLID